MTTTRWDLLLVTTSVLVLTAVARVHLLFPALATVRPVLLAGVLGTLLYLLDRHPRRRITCLASPVTAWLLAFAAWAVLAVPTALIAPRSGIFVTDSLLKTLVIFALVAGVVRGLPDVERLALVYFAGAAIYAVVILAGQDVTADSWRLTELYTYDPNDFATFAVTALPLGIYFMARPGPVVGRIAAVLGSVALGAAFVWAGSRGGFLALLGVGLFLLVRYRAVAVRWRVAGVGVLAAVVFLIASDQYWQQMGTLLEPAEDYNTTAETGRIQVWERGLEYMLDRPLFGVGPNNFAVAEGLLSPLAVRQQYGFGVRWTAPHNSLIQVGAEMGLPGLLLFLALLGATFRLLARVQQRGRRARPGQADPRALAQALTASLIGFSIGAFFLSLAYSPMLYTLIALAVATDRVCRVQPSRRPHPVPAVAGRPTGAARGAS